MPQTIWPHIIWAVTIIVIFVVYCFFSKDRVSKIIDENIKFKKRDDKGIIQEGRPRNIWDYSLFPGISRIWYNSEWQTLIAMLLLIGLIFIYLYTKDQGFLNLLGINFGLLIGTMIKK